jgi:hypothetical protein
MPEFTNEDRERLVRVETNVENLTNSFDNYLEVAVGEIGFPRCATHREKLDNIEKRQSNTRTAVVGGIVLIIVTLVTTHWESIAGVLLK